MQLRQKLQKFVNENTQLKYVFFAIGHLFFPLRLSPSPQENILLS